MAGEMVFRRVYAGKETVRGTAVAADTLIALDSLNVSDNRVRVARRFMSPYRAENQGYYDAAVGMSAEGEGPLYFEQLPIWLSMGLKGGVTPTASGSEQTWDFEPSLTAANTPDTFTFEWGDDAGAKEAAYCFCPQLVIAGATEEAVMIRPSIVGRQQSVVSFTAGISYPTLSNPALGQNTQYYIDASGAGIGGTIKNGLLIDYELSISYLVMARFMDGYLYFTKHKEPELIVRLAGTYEWSAATAEYTAYLNRTRRFVRLYNAGDTITVNPHAFTFDIAGTYIEFGDPMNDDRNGNDIVSFVLEGEYDATWNKMLDATVVTTTSAI